MMATSLTVILGIAFVVFVAASFTERGTPFDDDFTLKDAGFLPCSMAYIIWTIAKRSNTGTVKDANAAPQPVSHEPAENSVVEGLLREVAEKEKRLEEEGTRKSCFLADLSFFDRQVVDRKEEIRRKIAKKATQMPTEEEGLALLQDVKDLEMKLRNVTEEHETAENNRRRANMRNYAALPENSE